MDPPHVVPERDLSVEHTVVEILLACLVVVTLGGIFLIAEKRPTEQSYIHGLFKRIDFFEPVGGSDAARLDD